MRNHNRAVTSRPEFGEIHTPLDHNKSQMSSIINPELDNHRKMVLGSPGSKKWNEYHAELAELKRQMFGGDPTNVYIQKGGVNEDVAAAIAASMSNVAPAQNGSSEDVAAAIAASIEPAAQPEYNPKYNYECEEAKYQWLRTMFLDSERDITRLIKMATDELEYQLKKSKVENVQKVIQSQLDEISKFTEEFNKIIHGEKSIICSAEDVKIHIIPPLLIVYMSLIDGLYNTQFKNLRDSEKKIQSDDFRSFIGKIIILLRRLNLYSNPVFFDDLYYYYYFLSLDKIFPWLDSLFRLFDFSKPKPQTKKNDSDVTVEMRAYEVFNKPNVKPNDRKYFWYEMNESSDRPPNISTELIDQFFNLLNIDSSPYKQSKIATKVGSKFEFKNLEPNSENDVNNISVSNKVDEEDSANISSNVDAEGNPVIKKTKTTGGGVLGLFNLDSAADTEYTYLLDNPLEKEFQQMLSDEDSVYDDNIYLCIYSLDKSCKFEGDNPTPFLKFISHKSEDKWTFPSFHF